MAIASVGGRRYMADTEAEVPTTGLDIGAAYWCKDTKRFLIADTATSLNGGAQKSKMDATTAPGTGDDSGDGYTIGSRWFDVTADKEYVALDVSLGAAVWKETTAAAGAGSSATTVEVNLGAAGSEHWRGKFTITDAAITATSKVRVWQESGPYTGKGTRADEAEMDQFYLVAVPASGSAVVHWRTLAGIITTFSEVRGNQPVGSANTQHGSPDYSGLVQKVIGKVRGNVKFTYAVYA